ncbi:MAG: transposase [Gammaproteobacteria bacterium]|nr:transposase [Gammaproteobacteria bacterium]
MTYPRSMTVSSLEAGFYHCICRCVRQAWLCGHDEVSGRDYEHRRDWIEQKLITLAGIFAVELYAWAVMSNHSHVVLRIDPLRPEQWSDEEVAERWARLTIGLHAPSPDDPRTRMRVRALLAAPERLREIRERLGSLSWFMRYLNESIARMANAEDECNGRFWEGRFQCQALLDDDAVLACMTYVDLNPIRAGMCETLEDSDFTSIQRRLRELETDDLDANLEPLAGEHQDRDLRSGSAPTSIWFVSPAAWPGERIADLIPLHTHPALRDHSRLAGVVATIRSLHRDGVRLRRGFCRCTSGPCKGDWPPLVAERLNGLARFRIPSDPVVAQDLLDLNIRFPIPHCPPRYPARPTPPARWVARASNDFRTRAIRLNPERSRPDPVVAALASDPS